MVVEARSRHCMSLGLSEVNSRSPDIELKPQTPQALTGDGCPLLCKEDGVVVIEEEMPGRGLQGFRA